MTDMERMCSAAISYVDLGWAVLPVWGVQNRQCACGDPGCQHPGKHPCGRLAPHGCHSATTDGTVVCEWFNQSEPINIGAATGPESGTLVIDIDPRNGGDRASLGDLPETATAATGGGGWHLVYQYPKGMDIRGFSAEKTPKLGPGIDVKAKGGYIILPPSQHISGGEYRWLRDPRGGLAELPPHILAKLIEKPGLVETSAIVSGVIPKGRRDDTLTSLAGSMRRRGMSEAGIVAALREENKRCEEPLPDTDLKRIGRSIAKKEPADPPSSGLVVPRPVYIRLQDVQAKPISWFWRCRIPFAMLSLLIGIEGLGKTFLALYMAASASIGRLWPDSDNMDDAPTPGNVILLTSEDHLEYTIRPRFDALGGDPARLFALRGITSDAGDDFFDVMQHLPVLEAMIQEVGNVRLVLVDPLTAFLGSTDQHKNGEVRVALSRFNALAERHGCAVLGISHLSKDTSKAAIHRTLGSVAFSAAARAVWLVAQDREDEERRLFVPVKMNLGPMAKSLAFRIENMTVRWEAGQFECKADDALAVDGGREDASALTEARDWLEGLLSDGRVRSTEIQKMARLEHIAASTLKRAKAKIGAQAVHDGIGTASSWYWQLPDKGDQT